LTVKIAALSDIEVLKH